MIDQSRHQPGIHAQLRRVDTYWIWRHLPAPTDKSEVCIFPKTSRSSIMYSRYKLKFHRQAHLCLHPCHLHHCTIFVALLPILASLRLGNQPLEDLARDQWVSKTVHTASCKTKLREAMSGLRSIFMCKTGTCAVPEGGKQDFENMG